TKPNAVLRVRTIMLRSAVLVLLAGCASAPPAAPPIAPLRTSPGVVYKLADPGRESTESATFMLARSSTRGTR
ncbi:MAG TPA: hypothetical protein VFV54_08840, partial [Thermoanaerobaculia bacterium]|nr:hypothetical protein [Thermoanaerobaculia bacterium]